MKIEELHKLFLQFPVISTDTRNILPNSIFFALKGSNFNGNKFAMEALSKGAAYAIIDEAEFAIDEKLILVEDVLVTLQQLSTFHRKYINIPVIGITGSNGKTTTKELIYSVLSQKFNVYATKGNLNNHIGVPLTLLSLTKEHEMAIVEMGANHQGEIAFLCSICLPNYGLITNIGKAHLEGFGGEEGVIKGKTELYKFIRKTDGLLFVNSDDELIMKVSGGINKIEYGSSEKSFVTGKIIENSSKITFSYSTKNEVLSKERFLPIHSNLSGNYNYINMLASVCIASYFNIKPEMVKIGIESYIPNNNRSEIVVKNGITFFLDAYNANPSSMEVSINNFDEISKNRKRIAVIGGMNELGDYSEFEHIKLIKQLETKKFNTVILVGKHFSKLDVSASFFKVLEVEEVALLKSRIDFDASYILVKGSRTNQLEKILSLF